MHRAIPTLQSYCENAGRVKSRLAPPGGTRYAQVMPSVSPTLADLHCHTTHSHGLDHAPAMLAAGRAAGLAVLGFTEHSPRPASHRYPADEFADRVAARFPAYVAEALALREAPAPPDSPAPPRVLLGVEWDYLPETEADCAAFLAAHPLDYALGGVHFVGTWGFDYAPADWDALDEDATQAVYGDYYALAARMAATGLFQMAAHLDLVKLFSVERHRRWLAAADGKRAVETALAALAAAGMVLEISSAGLRKPCKEIYPGPAILKLARAMDLPIALSSDAHAASQVAFQFPLLAETAQAHGWTGQTIATRRGKEFLPFAS